MEVHGMRMGGGRVGTSEVGGGGMITTRGRSTLGYLRKPGGSMPVQAGRTEEQEEAFREACMGTWDGPRQRYIRRKRIRQMELVHCREDGQEERTSKTARASEAWEEEVHEEEALSARMVAAIDEGEKAACGARRRSWTVEPEPQTAGSGPVGGDTGGGGITRKDVVQGLRRLASLQAGEGARRSSASSMVKEARGGEEEAAWAEEVRKKRRRSKPYLM